VSSLTQKISTLLGVPIFSLSQYKDTNFQIMNQIKVNKSEIFDVRRSLWVVFFAVALAILVFQRLLKTL